MEIVKKVGTERREDEVRKEKMLIQDREEAPRSKGEVEGRSRVRREEGAGCSPGRERSLGELRHSQIHPKFTFSGLEAESAYP